MPKNAYHQKRDDNFIKLKEEKSEILLNWGKDKYIRRYILEDTITEEQYPQNLPQPLLLSYGVNLNIQEAKYDNIIEKIISSDDKSYAINSIFNDFTNNFHDPLIVLNRLSTLRLLGGVGGKLKDSEKKIITDIIDLIINTLNNFLNLIDKNEKIQIKHENTNFFFIDNNNKLTLQHLSEGYRDHILLITDIIIRILTSRNKIFKNKEINIDNNLLKKAKGVILIDEFDRHLHPTWQRSLLSKLKNVFAGIQFILTTHNIFSLQAAEGNMAIILQQKDNKIEAVEKEIKYGLSIKSIYNLFFNGEDKFFASITEERFEKFYKLLLKIETTKSTKNEENKFISVTKELLQSSEEVRVIIYRELRQLERQTGKVFNYG